MEKPSLARAKQFLKVGNVQTNGWGGNSAVNEYHLFLLITSMWSSASVVRSAANHALLCACSPLPWVTWCASTGFTARNTWAHGINYAIHVSSLMGKEREQWGETEWRSPIQVLPQKPGYWIVCGTPNCCNVGSSLPMGPHYLTGKKYYFKLTFWINYILCCNCWCTLCGTLECVMCMRASYSPYNACMLYPCTVHTPYTAGHTPTWPRLGMVFKLPWIIKNVFNTYLLYMGR